MRSALTRLTLLFGASVILYAAVGTSVAVAGNPCNQSNSPAECQYYEGGGSTLKAPKHHPGTTRHTSTTTTPAASTTSTNSGGAQTVPAGTGTTAPLVSPHHKRKHRPNRRHHKTGKARVRRTSPASRRQHAQPHKPASNSTRLAATGSSGGMGLWLPVILALVLVGGSAAGIFRYRRNH